MSLSTPEKKAPDQETWREKGALFNGLTQYLDNLKDKIRELEAIKISKYENLTIGPWGKDKNQEEEQEFIETIEKLKARQERLTQLITNLQDEFTNTLPEKQKNEIPKTAEEVKFWLEENIAEIDIEISRADEEEINRKEYEATDKEAERFKNLMSDHLYTRQLYEVYKNAFGLFSQSRDETFLGKLMKRKETLKSLHESLEKEIQRRKEDL